MMQQADQVEQNKVAAAVLTGNVWEAPDVADADGAACADQQEAQPGAEGFSFHGFLYLFLTQMFLFYRG